MKRFILTGTPGSGKTSIIRALSLGGHDVIDEAATDIITEKQALGIPEPWKNPTFLDDVIHLQRLRQLTANQNKGRTQFYDRSPLCTYALAVYLGIDPRGLLTDEIHRILTGCIYDQRVFFIHNLGFIHKTQARTINFDEALKFEKIHLTVYKKFGYKIIPVLPGSIDQRKDFIVRNSTGEVS